MKKKRSSILRVFALSVRTRRKALGWSQEVLAEKADLNWSYVSRLERQLVNISLTNAERIARGLGCDLHEMLK